MKKTIQLLLLVGLAAISTGCATSYMADRGRDAADIFTLTVGTGIGAKVRTGPVNVGVFRSQQEFVGLRCGEPFYDSSSADDSILHSQSESYTYDFVGVGQEKMTYGEDRGKDHAGFTLFFIYHPTWDDKRYRLEAMTQIEAAVGVGVMVRAGFNPGELLDFFLGWFTIDIYNDDLEKRKSNKVLEATSL